MAELPLSIAEFPFSVPDRIDQLLSRAAAAHPGRRAVVADTLELDYAALDTRVTSVTAALQGLTGAGEVVAVASVLHPDFAVAYYAVARAGRTAAVVNPLLREEDLLHVLSLSGATVAVVDAALEERLAHVRDRLPALRTVLRIGALPEGTAPRPTRPPGPATPQCCSSPAGPPAGRRRCGSVTAMSSSTRPRSPTPTGSTGTPSP